MAQLDPMVAEALPDDRNQRALTEVETRVDLEPVMNQFDTRTRALLRMVMAGWSDSEIARAINVDRSTVGRRLRRLRLMFPWLE
ncbi:MAG: helix-turn-helix domain-containing protein [Armatimonadetes bacterium]|nr:helix-turn-helix domain-containing protein [Armatimonadota bacterium]MDE2206352.1 helix-turn-helix domain-containing protein [Armatimonadota bacterium]